ncbi:hypothetical protein JCM15415_20320 [Methanobacterium movens]
MNKYISVLLICAAILIFCGSAAATVTEQTVIPNNNNVNLTVANDNGARMNNSENDSYSFYPGSGSGGLNALKITDNSTDSNTGKVVFTDSQSGTFYLTYTGGKGYADAGILMVAINGTLPDNFQLKIDASGYQWIPAINGLPPLFADITFNPSTVNETFLKSDFSYGPQTWKPYWSANYPLYEKQNMSDTANTFSIMFIDLYAGLLRSSGYSETLNDLGMIKINYEFLNLPLGSLAAFNGYAYSEYGEVQPGVFWTNRVNTISQSATDTSGYYVTGKGSSPSAEFTATPITGTVPLQVQFNDQSTNNPTSWAWDFNNDGIIDSTAQNPTHTYTQPGTYTIKLTATNQAGSDSLTKIDYITVNAPPVAPPVAAFTGTPSSGNAALQVQFNDQSTNNPTSWAWDFNNDGIIDSTAQNPTHTYTQPGTYTIKLTATNAGGSDSVTRVDYITVTVPAVDTYNRAMVQDAARRVRDFITSRGVLPNWVRMVDNAGVTNFVTMPAFLELSTASLISGANEFKAMNVQAAPRPTGPAIVNRNLYKSGYMDMASRVNTFIRNNGVAPNFARSSLGNIRFQSLVDSFARIVAFEADRGVLPNYVVINTRRVR